MEPSQPRKRLKTSKQPFQLPTEGPVLVLRPAYVDGVPQPLYESWHGLLSEPSVSVRLSVILG